MQKVRLEFVDEAILNAIRELEEMEAEYDWFVSPSIQSLYKAHRYIVEEQDATDSV